MNKKTFTNKLPARWPETGSTSERFWIKNISNHFIHGAGGWRRHEQKYFPPPVFAPNYLRDSISGTLPTDKHLGGAYQSIPIPKTRARKKNGKSKEKLILKSGWRSAPNKKKKSEEKEKLYIQLEFCTSLQTKARERAMRWTIHTRLFIYVYNWLCHELSPSISMTYTPIHTRDYHSPLAKSS